MTRHILTGKSKESEKVRCDEANDQSEQGHSHKEERSIEKASQASRG